MRWRWCRSCDAPMVATGRGLVCPWSQAFLEERQLLLAQRLENGDTEPAHPAWAEASVVEFSHVTRVLAGGEPLDAAEPVSGEPRHPMEVSPLLRE